MGFTFIKSEYSIQIQTYMNTDLLCLKGKLYKHYLIITDLGSKLLNDREEFLLFLSVI